MKKLHGNTSKHAISAAQTIIDNRDAGGHLTAYGLCKRLRGTDQYASRPSVIAALRRLGRDDLIGDEPAMLKQHRLINNS